MILALLALLPQAPSTVQLVTPSMVATSLGNVPTRRLRIAGPAGASAVRLRLEVHLDAQEAIRHEITNLSGQVQPGYGGSTGGWISAWVGGPPYLYGCSVGVSFWHGTCGGNALGVGQTLEAGNLFPIDWSGEWVFEDLPDFMRGAVWPVYVTLHAQDMLSPAFPSVHHSWVRGAGMSATLTLTPLED